MRIALGSDHAGIVLRDEVVKTIKELQMEVVDFGTFTNESVDYPDYAVKVCKAVISGEADKGILLCGTGIGMSIAANKIKGIRCAHVVDVFTAAMSAEHNKANVIALGGRITKVSDVHDIIKAYLTTDFGGGNHQRRVDKITALE